MGVFLHDFRSFPPRVIRYGLAALAIAALSGCGGAGVAEGPSTAEIEEELRDSLLNEAAEHVTLDRVRRVAMRPGPEPASVAGAFTARLRLEQPVRRVVEGFDDAVVVRTILKPGASATIFGRLLATQHGEDWRLEALSVERSDLLVIALSASESDRDALHVGEEAFEGLTVVEVDSDAHEKLLEQHMDALLEQARDIRLTRPITPANVRSRAQQLFASTTAQRRSLFNAIVRADGLRFAHGRRGGRHLILRVQDSDAQALTFSGVGVDYTEMPPRRLPFRGFVTHNTENEPIALLEGAFAHGLTQATFDWLNKDGVLGYGRTDRRLAPLTPTASQELRQRAKEMDAAYRAIQYAKITTRLYAAEERNLALQQMPRLVTPAVVADASQNLDGDMFDGDYDSYDRPEGSGHWMKVQLQPIMAQGVALLFEDAPDRENNGFLMSINGGAPMQMAQPEEDDGMLVVRFDQPQQLHQIRINTQDGARSSFILRELTVIPLQ